MKTIILVLSLLLNALFVTGIMLAVTADVSSFSYSTLSSETPSVASAAMVSFPAASGPAIFGPIEIHLKRGEKAALQFSVRLDKKQSNFIFTTLFDRSIIAVEQTPQGIVITALTPGTTIMQTLADDGFKDIALVYVDE